jgi:hypothetical protein
LGALDRSLLEKLSRLVDDVESDTHKILVWHIATSLCEIKLDLHAAKELMPSGMRSRLLFVRRKPTSTGAEEALWDHYITAATLSNYCAYLVMKMLVPDSSLVALKLLAHVQDEITRCVTRGMWKPSHNRRRSMHDVLQSLMDSEGLDDMTHSLTRRGTTLAMRLMKSFCVEDRGGPMEEAGGLLDGVPAAPRGVHRSKQTQGAPRRETGTHDAALGAAFSRRRFPEHGPRRAVTGRGGSDPGHHQYIKLSFHPLVYF